MGTLFIISGPSGVGKGTLVKLLMAEDSTLSLSVSCTTRSPRAGEEDGVAYFFITKEEFQKRGVFVEIKRNGSFAVTVGGDVECKLSDYDFCGYLDKDKYVLQGIEKAGIPLFNGYAAIEACDDKMTTFLSLAGNGIKMPLTLPAPLCYDDAERSEEELNAIEGALGYPLVIKSCYGSCGTGVYLAENRDALKQIGRKLMREPHLYQQYIEASRGRDIRVIVIGGKVLGAMTRRSDTDFRSNLALGATAAEYSLAPSEVAMCEKIAALLGLDYCGIDLLFGEDGPYLCEVNSNAFFTGFERTTGKNVAGAYADYILSKLKKE